MTKNTKRAIIEWIKVIFVALFIALIITCFIRPTLVKGYSMYPTLKQNDYLIINKISYINKSPQNGDIIVFKTLLKEDNGRKKDLVKRVIAKEGQHIKINNNNVYVDDKLINETYINNLQTIGDVDLIIPKARVFVMGDNRTNSMDSRDSQVGIIKNTDIIGKVILRLYPFNKLGKVR